MKRVLHIQFSMKSGGSAAWKLHQAFSRQPGFSSEVLTLHSEEQRRPALFGLSKWAVLKAKLNNRLHKLVVKYDQKQYGLFTYPIMGTDVAGHECVKRAEVIYIHWVQMGFMTLDGLETLIKTGKQIIFFMHDMWSITGGCHNSFDCAGYQTDCSNCPILDSSKSLASMQLRRKEAVFNHENVSFISPSRWLKDCAERSIATAGRPVHYIPNYFNSRYFVPQDKVAAKQKLGIDPDVRVLLFGAVNLFSAYKGFEYLEQALNYFPEIYTEDRLQILIFGEGSEADIQDRFPYPVKFLGYLNDEKDIAQAYGATDVFVIPSVADNQPTMVVESLACGVPVVGFETGGIPDMIRHRSNGYLAASRNYRDLAEGIKYCLEESIQGYQLESFDPELIMSLHNELINERDTIGV
ncbi:glycosyltransferase [Algoriphagus terrigena]|uniref:glycosyltransferase n=1 Tax=Algoriphagus terrigena TaxID=344884 RepID=UPI000421B474|nr:glycosyltransferase [Algoriphagus terrigena]